MHRWPLLGSPRLLAWTPALRSARYPALAGERGLPLPRRGLRCTDARATSCLGKRIPGPCSGRGAAKYPDQILAADDALVIVESRAGGSLGRSSPASSLVTRRREGSTPMLWPHAADCDVAFDTMFRRTWPTRHKPEDVSRLPGVAHRGGSRGILPSPRAGPPPRCAQGRPAAAPPPLTDAAPGAG